MVTLRDIEALSGVSRPEHDARFVNRNPRFDPEGNEIDLFYARTHTNFQQQPAAFHQYARSDPRHNPDRPNVKYVNLDTGDEYVFDWQGHIVTDPRIRGSFNYQAKLDTFSDKYKHFTDDIVPWIAWGNGDGDTSHWADRYLQFIGAGVISAGKTAVDLLDLYTSMAPFATGPLFGKYILSQILSLFDQAGNEASPLILDLDGDGIELSSLIDGRPVFWDLDEDGFQEQTAWVGPDDGILAFDWNDNGKIDGQSEIFGSVDQDGFAVLSLLDSNNDAIIDNSDIDYSRILVWQDLNVNGRSEEEELETLSSSNIRSISLASTSSTSTISGNRISSISSYVLNDGVVRTIVDAWFQYDDISTFYIPGEGYAVDSLFLPELRGYGHLPWLSAAMSDDAQLSETISSLTNLTTNQLLAPTFDLDGRFRTLMWDWANVETTVPTIRGPYIDARDLAFLEVLTSGPFTQRGNPRPMVEAATTLTNAMETVENALLFRFFAQAHRDSFITGIQYYNPLADEVAGTLGIDFTKLRAIVAGWGASGATLAQGWATLVRIIDGAFGIEDLTSADRTALEAAITASDPVHALTLASVLDVIYPGRGLGLNGTSGTDTINGGIGNDSIDGGSGNDTLSGRGGHDSLNGGTGDDTLNGETGDDTMQGGSGNDTYLYTSGLDTIRDTAGSDTLRFGSGVTLAQLRLDFSPTNEGDAYLYINGELSLIIEDMFTTGGRIETFRFADGSSFNTSAFGATRTGTTANDTMVGDDLPLFPHDVLAGGNGDDRLIGGLGDDWLTGNAGNDTFVVTSGHDRITASAGIDRIEFGAGYTLAAAQLVRSGDNLVISFGGVAAVTVIDQFDSGEAIESIVFQNGQTIDLLARRYTLEGTAGRDTLRGISTGGGSDLVRGLGGDDTLYGNGGDDDLDGGPGNDRLDGGDGHDTLRGDAGDDTMLGGAGNDTYVHASGVDLIYDRSGSDVLQFGTGVTLSRLTLRISAANEADAEILIDGVLAVVVEDMFVSGHGIETLRIADGSTVNLATLTAFKTGTTGADTLLGTDAPFFPHDLLDGGGGNDRLIGGLGDDRLYGGADNDFYLVTSGHDRIFDSSGTADHLEFGPGYTLGAAQFARAGSDLVISFAGVAAATIHDQFDSSGSIETIGFKDGQTVNLLTLRHTVEGTETRDVLRGISTGGGGDVLCGLGGDDTLYGYDGNDELDGGAGNDTMNGARGDDRYVRSAGYDRIDDSGGIDTIVMSDVTAARIGLTRDDGDLIVSVDGGDSIRIANQFSAAGQIETLTLAGGAIFNLLGVAYPITGGAGNDRIYGISQGGNPDDVIRGLGGADRLYGEGGDDQLDGGDGDDDLYGGVGNDRYWVGSGDNYVWDEGGAQDTVLLPSGVLPANVTLTRLSAGYLIVSWAGGRVVIEDAYDATAAVERLAFANGERWSLVERFAPTVGTDSGERIDGNREELGSRNDTIRGLLGNDTLNGYDGNDLLEGGGGNDLLDGGTQADRLEGGPGDDTYVVDNVADTVIEKTGEGLDLIRAGVAFELPANVENLTLTGSAGLAGAGNALANVLIGNSGANWLVGGAGDDVIDGGAGADRMEGGAGNDIYHVGHVDDRVNEKPGEGTDLVNASISYELGANLENLTLTGSGHLSGGGNSLANLLTGNSGNNWLAGGGGNDVIDGRQGADRMEGGEGDDLYRVDNAGDRVNEKADQGIDTIESSISLTLEASIEALTLLGTSDIGGAGNELANLIIGNGGANILGGGGGDDRLDGGGGADTLKGGAGNDVFVVDHAGDKVQEKPGEGSDTVEAWIDWSLAGNIERLKLMGTADLAGTGNELANLILGNGGANVLRGGDGDDALRGGLGSDTLFGGAGADAYYFETSLGLGNVDTIGDFVAADDTLILDRTIFTGIAANGTLAAGAFRVGTAAVDADDRILYDAATGNLFYDADGVGGVAAVQFARLNPGLSLTNADFMTVA